MLRKVEKQLTLYFINKFWAEHLDYVAEIYEGLHLAILGKKDPLDQFLKNAIVAFDEMMEIIDREIIRTFKVVEINVDGIDMDKEGLKDLHRRGHT